ncbi:FtsJ-like methyltransferase-domain-containing protein [Lentinula edodes]|uniref:FtsJ-like methyltransferase-domain-containing protein n=1 Tax=Lentinula edodes TaxID=5353 RepID=UPI001E8D6D2A|nr:FtsJ-like methyltransferase-domain-containing protein [Lentinula edodes]KAH7873971.1 FtsJ-like methyltransferase-domain-containing protein [Lentinula edodes]
MSLRLPFTPTFPSFGAKTKKSSAEWLRRQSRDPYVKQRALGAVIASTKTSSILGNLGSNNDGISSSISSPLAFRSRSAFKLIEIHEKYDQFLLKPDVQVVVDLGAAPGGWSQVVSQVVHGKDPTQLDAREDVDEVVEYPVDQDEEGTEEDSDTKDTWHRKRKSKIKAKNRPKPLPPKPLEFYDPLNFDAEIEHLSSSSLDLQSKVKIIAVDRLSMDPITGVQTLKADFLHPRTEGMIRSLIDGPSITPYKLTLSTPDTPKVDVVLSDIAPNTVGVPAVDSEANFQVAQAVFQFAYKYLRTADEIGRTRGGVLVMKHFAHPKMDVFRKEVLEEYFKDVIYTKPRASRQESKEGYFLCRGFWPREYR